LALTRGRPLPRQFWEFVILVIGTLEATRIGKGWNSLNAPATEQMKDSYEPGNQGFDPCVPAAV
jgi:hypothetical protein